MSYTWNDTRASVRRLKSALQEADENTRYKFAFWVSGFAIMATAIVMQFGWAGILFCFGMVVWKAGHH